MGGGEKSGGADPMRRYSKEIDPQGCGCGEWSETNEDKLLTCDFSQGPFRPGFSL